MSDQILDLEIRLLLLRYGKTKIINVLERLGEQSIEELKYELQNAEKKVKKKSLKTNTSPKAISEFISAESSISEEARNLIQALMIKYENKMFLPQLKDALRFIERAGIERAGIKTRKTATKAVIKALGSLSLEEITRLVKETTEKKESTFSSLARALMGDSSTEQQVSTETKEEPIKD